MLAEVAFVVMRTGAPSLQTGSRPVELDSVDTLGLDRRGRLGRGDAQPPDIANVVFAAREDGIPGHGEQSLFGQWHVTMVPDQPAQAITLR